MKRIVKCLCLLLVCTVCFCCVSGCSEKNITSIDEIVQALKDVGYKDAYYGDYHDVYLSNDTDSAYFKFCGVTEDEQPDDGKTYIITSEVYLYRGGLWSGSIYNIKEDEDYSKALDAVMPFFDSEYEGNASEIINQLFMYENNGDFEEYSNLNNYSTKEVKYERDKYTISFYIRKWSLSNGDAEKDICVFFWKK